MVRIILICFFVGFASLLKGQTNPYPINQNLGNASTLVKIPNYGGFTGGFIPFSFTDTSVANTTLTFLKTYDGAFIKTTTPINAIWWRSIQTNSWVQIFPSAVDTSGVQVWKVGGNSLFSSTLPTSFGTNGLSPVIFKTNNVTRFILPATGILDYNSNPAVKGLGYDTITKTMYAVPVGGGGGSVSISDGFGIINTPNPITGTGTIEADTAELATLFHVDSVATNVPISALRAAESDNHLDNQQFYQKWDWYIDSNVNYRGLAITNTDNLTDASYSRNVFFVADSSNSDYLSGAIGKQITSHFVTAGVAGQIGIGGGHGESYAGMFEANTTVGGVAPNYNYGIYSTAANGSENWSAWLNGRLKLTNLNTGVGTKSLRINAAGEVTTTDTTIASTPTLQQVFATEGNTAVMTGNNTIDNGVYTLTELFRSPTNPDQTITVIQNDGTGNYNYQIVARDDGVGGNPTGYMSVNPNEGVIMDHANDFGIHKGFVANLDSLRIYGFSGFGSQYTQLAVTGNSGEFMSFPSIPSSHNATDSMVVMDASNRQIGFRPIPTSGSISLAAIGSSPNANGATITGSTLNLEPASASFGGVVTTGTQTFAGAKSSNTSFTAPYIYGGNMTTTYGGYEGGVFGGTASHGVLDFVDNGTRIGEFYTTASSFNFFTGSGKTLSFMTNASATPSIYADAAQNVGINNASPTSTLTVTGNVELNTAGNKLLIATGSNASIGTSTLSSGTITVNTTAVSTNSKIIVVYNTPSGTLASGLSAPSGSIVNGTSFIINSLTTAGIVNTLDNSTVTWWIIN